MAIRVFYFRKTETIVGNSLSEIYIYSVIEYCTINPINGGPETNDIVLKFYAVYIGWKGRYLK